MRDLSLHILDLIENSIRAGATEVSLTVSEDPVEDMMKVSIEDNGPGLSVPPDVALDPFYTTKKGKRVGLGLSLFREAAEQAGGSLKLSKSGLGGLAVEAAMRLTHVDRPPLGDLAGVVSVVACTNPDLGFCCTVSAGPRRLTVRVCDVLRSLSAEQRHGLAVARAMAERTREAMTAVQLMP